ncbi:probable caffeoyl-CoA O-methyltransferase 2 isoform X4 [Rhodamnia argentea]|uniref:Probable caffeoyl-CoA O-methyltransferase 2 isoform X4 n=1 Tax=Rhodamnia argentea TaxID=178133 RepID=A0A8B8QC49_9MYRT|nr:probable caffeoyl-CoA O-methyltransferase 2 isoform X4 [Rhodamnia argentea]
MRMKFTPTMFRCASVVASHSALPPVRAAGKFLPSSKSIAPNGSVLGRGRCCCFGSSSPYVVLEDRGYGNKQVISITPQLYDYVLSNVREPEILQQLRKETASMRGSQMQGYSSLAVALVLPESGFLVACERDAKSLEVAKKYYELAGVSHKVSVRHGLASDTLHSLILNGETCSYDFAFVDAEKRMNEEYFELLLQLVRVGGVIVIDNVLWHGKVADPMVNDMKTISIRNFNRRLMGDDRISTSMVPIGDGILICRKR